MSILPSLILSMFLDECKKLIDYVRELCIFRGGTYKNTGEHHVGCVGSRFTSLAKYTGKFLEI